MKNLYIQLIVSLLILNTSAQTLRITEFTPSTSCDYLVVCPDSFLTCGTKLAQYRNSYQYDDVENAKVVTLSTVLSSFPVNDTNPVAFSLWYALKYATEHWTIKPKYVVFLGDDSVHVDGFDTLSQPPKSVGCIPTFYFNATKWKINGFDTTKFEIEYDYGDFPYLFAGVDTFPHLIRKNNSYSHNYTQNEYSFALGRIPASTYDECTIYIDKLIRYEQHVDDNPAANKIIFAADDAMQGDKIDQICQMTPHQTSADRVWGRYCNGWFTDKIYLSTFNISPSGKHEQARVHFFDIVNKGARNVVYFGHGHPSRLSDEAFLRVEDSSMFTNQMQPVSFYSFSCSNGGFLRDTTKLMCKSFLFAPGGGCISYVAAPTLTYANSNEVLAFSIFSQCSTSVYQSIGKVLINAFKTCNNDFNLHYEILGDPAIRFTKKHIDASTDIHSEQNGNITCLTTMAPSITLPVKYRYQISTRDSVTCIDGLSPKFVDDSIITTFDGTSTDGRILANIPQSSITANSHYILYVWNKDNEFRMDTSLSIAAAVVSKVMNFTKTPQFICKNNILTITIPASVRASAASIELFNIKGAKLKKVSIPLSSNTAVFNLNDINLSTGQYIVRLDMAGLNMTNKICVIR